MKLMDLLLEITYDEAIKALSLTKSDASDADKLKQAFRKASLKAHPDMGGNKEAMQTVVAAKEFLDKFVGQEMDFKSRMASYDQRNKEYLDLGIAVLESLKEKFQFLKFTDYFKKVYSEPFNYKIKSESPTPQTKGSISHALLYLEFSNQSRDKVFTMDLSCYLVDVKYDKNLGSGKGNISYPLMVQSYGFVDNKKLKINQRDYQRTQNHDIMVDPTIAFPAAKLEKFKTTSGSKVFKKADMLLFLKTRLENAKWDGEVYRIDLRLDKRVAVIFRRGTFMKMPYWNIELYIDGKYSTPKSKTFQETVETAKYFEKVSKEINNLKTSDSILEYLRQELTK
jgi:hypothetical protein